MASMVSQRALSTQTKRQQHASQSLATGQRIVQASDDPAGLAIEQIAKMRSNFGSLQSRMESVVNTLDVRNENLSSTRSQIMDADIAKEASNLASANVLQNSATSILAQANSQPFLAMKLLS